ncbi:MAG: hypothetical protein U9O24_06605 [Campylobacterota bacterium]|nr:hypothetical protein [Campylobacterota bacterium]
MDIPVKSVKEKCCDEQLKTYSIIDMDCLDDIGSTCDKVIECTDKYYLVEEKSITFSFLDNCCKEVNKSVDDYKYTNDEIQYLKIDEVIQLIQPINIDVKKRILSDSIVSLIHDSAKKSSNTTDILNKQFNHEKTRDMPIFYLYCNSGTAIDMIIHRLLTKYKRTFFIECLKLKEKLEQECA